MPANSLISIGLFALTCAGSAALAAPDEKLRAAAEQAQPALIETLHDMCGGSADWIGYTRSIEHPFGVARRL